MEMKATDKPLTLQECKNVASKKGHANIDQARYRMHIIDFVNLLNEAAELYKDSAIEAQKEELQVRCNQVMELEEQVDLQHQMAKADKEEIANLTKQVEEWEQDLLRQGDEIERLKAEVDLLQKANDGLRTNINLYAFRQRNYPEVNDGRTRLAERLNKSSGAYKKLKAMKDEEIEALKQALKKAHNIPPYL